MQKPRKNSMLRRAGNTALVALFWLGIWQAAAMLAGKPLLMAAPLDTFIALGKLAAAEEFWLSIGATFLRVASGVAISFVAGVALAYFASKLPFLQSLLRPFVAAVKATPVMSVIMLALLWFTSSFVPVFSCVLLCLPIFYTNTLSGIRGVDKSLLEMAAVFRVSHGRVVRGILVPSVLPNIYAALAVCLGLSWKSVVAAEVLSSPKLSMGYKLYATKLYLNTPELFAWTLTIIVISLIVEKGLKRVLPGGGAL